MQIDWFTFIAQIINFLILVALLKRLLYGPIKRAIRTREETIAASLKAAEDQAQQARAELEKLQNLRRELEDRRNELLSEAEADAEARRREMILQARAEVESMQQRWITGLEHEKSVFLRELRQRISEQVFKIARRVLADLADADLEHRLVDLFLRRLKHFSDSDRAKLIDSLERSEDGVLVRSSFELPAERREQIEHVLRTLIPCPGTGYEINARFEKAPELLCGIELQMQDRRIAWSISDYLQSLEEQLDMLFGSHATEQLQSANERTE